MFDCLVVNDSEKATLRSSQRIIAKYLDQVGPTTYLGSLSQDALKALQGELEAIRSRYLSVACFFVRHNHTHELAWIVGSKKNFDEEMGLYAHRRRTLGFSLEKVKETSVAKIVHRIIRIVALTHDIGKMNDAFQAKLQRAIHNQPGAAEFIRHEALSYYVLKQLMKGGTFESLGQLTTLDGAGLEALACAPSAESLRSAVQAYLKEDLKLLSEMFALGTGGGGRRRRGSVSDLSSAQLLEKTVLTLIAQLSLTHHRLPGLPSAGQELYTYLGSWSEESHFNESLSKDYQACLKFSKGSIFCNAEGPTALGNTLLEHLTVLREELNQPGVAEMIRPDTLIYLTYLYGRPLMVLSDCLGSGMKTDKETPANTLLGNTQTRGKTMMPGDTLVGHVGNVHRHARRQTHLAYNLVNNRLDPFPQLSVSAQRSIDKKRQPTGKFAWQNSLYESLKASHLGRPCFAVVTAETGSGKTIASAQIARALGSTRMTYCLGLRSLTLQTGASYQRDLGLGPTDLATIIGDPVAKKAFNSFGSESLEQDDYIVDVATSAHTDWMELVEDKRSPYSLADIGMDKSASLVTTPVVVCTVDQLIGITQLTKVRKGLLYLRMFSSDLILDEVDNYSPPELRHIQKLCYLAGLARKNVICLSATMGPVHVQALLAEYRAGLAANVSLTGQGTDGLLALGSNVCEAQMVPFDASTEEQALIGEVRAFNNQTIVQQAQYPAKVKHRVLDATAYEFGKITDEVLTLHARNGLSVLDNGGRLSTGFVRFNTVATARAYAAHLYQTQQIPEDTALALVCYHAKHSAIALSAIDKALKALTYRRGAEAGQFTSEAWAQYIRPASREAHVKNVIFVVVTTSILETGRDHDYDWAIVEPSSHRSLIQSAGRVRRHREVGESEHNFSIIRSPARSLDKDFVQTPKNPLNVWCKPGPLTDLKCSTSAWKENTVAGYAALLQTAGQVLGNTQLFVADLERDSRADGLLAGCYPDGIRSAAALQAPSQLQNPLALLEQYVLHAHLIGQPGQGIVFNNAYLQLGGQAIRAAGALFTNWSYQGSFRGGSMNDLDRVFLLSPPLADKHKAIERCPVSESGTTSYATLDSVTLDPARCLLGLPFALKGRDIHQVMRGVLEAELADYVSKGFTTAELIQLCGYAPQFYSAAQARELWYHPALGCDTANLQKLFSAAATSA